MCTQENGLIGCLYNSVFAKEDFKILKDNSSDSFVEPRVYFQEHWLGIKDFNHDYWTEIKTYDAFRKKTRDGINSYIESDDFEIKIQKEFEKLKSLLKQKELDEDVILNRLADAIEKVKFYKIPAHIPGYKKRGCYEYDANVKARLIDLINIDRELHKHPLAHFIRWYIYFALNHDLPNDLSENAKTRRDLEEYSDRVIRRYGGSCNPHAIREVYALATKEKDPNGYAIYDLADMHFFGYVKGINQDYNEAYKYYKKSAGIDGENSTVANSLALWSISYMFLRNKKDSTEPYYDFDDLKDLSYFKRIQIAYKRSAQAYSLSKLPAAANTIGVIARLTDKDPGCKGIDEFKEKKRILDCSYYFDLAAKGGFVYGYNNLAEEEGKKLIKDIDNPEKQKEHLEKYIENYKESADRNEAYAANKLGQLYLKGVSIINPIINKDKIVVSVEDRDLAYKYFKKAYKAYYIFNDRNSGWACINLKVYFENEIEDDEEVNTSDLDKIITRYNLSDKLEEEYAKKRANESLNIKRKKK